MKWDAFISYRHESGFLVAQVLYCRLELEGIHCFLDLEETKKEELDKSLIAAIEESPNFILILSKDSLKRCTDEKDWVRQEILSAVKVQKKIIPVMCDGFEWSDVPAGIPDEIRIMERTLEAVKLSKDYPRATIDRLKERMVGTRRTQIPLTTADFFRFYIDEVKVTGIDMAFHSGAAWYNSELVTVLNSCIRKNIPLRVLVNSQKAVGRICEHMKQDMRDYVKFSVNISNWKKRSKDLPELLEIRVLDNLPLLHRLYIIHQENGESAVNVKYYTYDNGIIEKDYRAVFTSQTDPSEYQLYKKEFDYLWEHAALTDTNNKHKNSGHRVR